MQCHAANAANAAQTSSTKMQPWGLKGSPGLMLHAEPRCAMLWHAAAQAGSTKMQHRGPKDSPESFESLWSLLSSILAARPHPMLAGMPQVPHIGSMPMGLGMGPLGMPGLEGMAAAAAAGTLPLPGRLLLL
eukprot:scaffold14370_cov18-Tisochrysis_lutea.AAC.1